MHRECNYSHVADIALEHSTELGLYEVSQDPPASEGKWRTQTKKDTAFERLQGLSDSLHEVARRADEKDTYL